MNISKNALTGDGTPQGKMDLAKGNGIIPECCANRILKAIKKKKEEVYIAGAKEKLGMYLKQFFPKLFSVLVRKIGVT
jgi:dehydrogenase/reductase SDR family protein 7B